MTNPRKLSHQIAPFWVFNSFIEFNLFASCPLPTAPWLVIKSQGTGDRQERRASRKEPPRPRLGFSV